MSRTVEAGLPDIAVDDAPGSTEQRDAVDGFNRQLANDPRFETACVPIREGVLIARYAGG